MLVSMGLESVLSKGQGWVCAACHLFLYPRSARAQGTGGRVGARGSHWPRQGQQGMQDLPQRRSQRVKGCGCLQLGLQTDTSLTFNLALPAVWHLCLLALSCLSAVYPLAWALSQPSSLPSAATIGPSLRKSKRDGPG